MYLRKNHFPTQCAKTISYFSGMEFDLRLPWQRDRERIFLSTLFKLLSSRKDNCPTGFSISHINTSFYTTFTMYRVTLMLELY